MNKFAIITLDTDTYIEEINQRYNEGEKIEILVKSYNRGFERIFNIIEKNSIKITLFLISSHLNFIETKIFKNIIYKHEIADHSYSHDRLLFQKNKEIIYEEIKKSKRTIYEKLNIIPKGFRAPGGNVSLKLIETIQDEYFYDSSIISSKAYNFFKNIIFLNKFKSKQITKTNRRPFVLNKNLIELPITEFEYIKLPTFSFFSTKLKKIKIDLIKTIKNSNFLNYVIHLHEFTSKKDFNTNIGLGFMNIIETDVKTNINYLNEELIFIKNHFSIYTALETLNFIKGGNYI